MIRVEEIDYIKEWVLKKGEELEVLYTSNRSDGLMYVNVIKHTQRTYRITGVLTISASEPSFTEVDKNLLQFGFTPRKKVSLPDNDQTLKWLREGFIIKEIRFKKDGRTPDSQHYRMGYRLFAYSENEKRKKTEAAEKELLAWVEKAKLVTSLSIPSHKSIDLRRLIKVVEDFCHQTAADIKVSVGFPSGWALAKRLRFLHFLVAFLQLSIKREQFDWKEIGASYYQEIGGSKRFDRDKNDFIEQLEGLAECPLVRLGLTSLGRITPFYFSGPLVGAYSSFQYGPVHALTDLSISSDDYRTTAKALWLVENRAILTRMASEENFLEETNSLIMCVDGHLRSSHKQCISQLLAGSDIDQVLIWCDYDPDGLQIAHEIYETVSDAKGKELKWIQPDQQVSTSLLEYEGYMLAFLEENRMEQEEMAGSREEWVKWLNH